MHADDGHIKLQGRVVLALQNGQVEQVRSAILKTDWNKMEQVTLQVIFFCCVYSVYIPQLSRGYPMDGCLVSITPSIHR